jgi:N6-adenosine-specific RNA methylase IME4
VSQLIFTAEHEELLVAPVGRHSAKPAVTRDKIVTLMGDLPRLELFARDRTPGWDCWGDEVVSDVIMTAGRPRPEVTQAAAQPL